VLQRIKALGQVDELDGLESMVDDCASSGDLGWRRPAREISLQAIDRLARHLLETRDCAIDDVATCDLVLLFEQALLQPPEQRCVAVLAVYAGGDFGVASDDRRDNGETIVGTGTAEELVDEFSIAVDGRHLLDDPAGCTRFGARRCRGTTRSASRVSRWRWIRPSRAWCATATISIGPSREVGCTARSPVAVRPRCASTTSTASGGGTCAQERS
jgi:hypothetical protein